MEAVVVVAGWVKGEDGGTHGAGSEGWAGAGGAGGGGASSGHGGRDKSDLHQLCLPAPPYPCLEPSTHNNHQVIPRLSLGSGDQTHRKGHASRNKQGKCKVREKLNHIATDWNSLNSDCTSLQTQKNDCKINLAQCIQIIPITHLFKHDDPEKEKQLYIDEATLAKNDSHARQKRFAC